MKIVNVLKNYTNFRKICMCNPGIILLKSVEENLEIVEKNCKWKFQKSWTGFKKIC